MQNFTVVIPIYNESEILTAQIRRLLAVIDERKLGVEYEIVLVENGSTDTTYRIAKYLSKRYPRVKVVHLDRPSYGQAFKAGILHAAYPYIYQFDLDFWDIDFLCMAQSVSDKYDIIVGSKNLAYSRDGRSRLRRFFSKCVEMAIQWRFRITLTDTHGLKALRKTRALPLLEEVVCANHFFDSELILRCMYQGCRIKELPVDLTEIRSSRFPFLVRSRDAALECLQLLSLNLKRKKHQNIGIFRRPAIMQS